MRDVTATIVKDHIFGDRPEMDDTGRIFILADIPEDIALTTRKCHAFDDDGEFYYVLDVQIPDDDVYLDDVLSTLLRYLGSWAGVTEIRFPGHPELDCS